MYRLTIALLCLGLAHEAAAQAPGNATNSRYMALIPLDRSDGTLSNAEWRILEEAMVTVSSKLVLPLGYLFLNSDTTLKIFEENGVDAAKACDRSCALDVAKEIKARYFLSGAVASAEGSHTGFVRLLDTNSGAQLDALKLEGVSVKELVAQFERKAENFFSKLPPILLGPSDSKINGSTTAPVLGQKTVLVWFESTPPGAFVSLDGKALCPQTPCRKAVPLGTHAIAMQKERYDTAGGPREITSATTIALELEPLFGWISVTSDPPGLPVAIDGAVVGKAPIERLELDPGQHEIVVEDPCHTRAGERVTVAKNVARNVSIRSEQKRAALDVVAEDEQRNALDAAILVDGREVGTAPSQVVVPACARRVELRAPNRAAWSMDLVLTEGETRRVEALLAGTVAHRFKSHPDGSVLVDGQEVCDWTPCEVNVGLGRHQVVFKRTAYDDFGVSVDFEPGGSTEVELVSTRDREDAEERASEQRAALVQKVGGRLLLAGAAVASGIYGYGGFVEANAREGGAAHLSWTTPLFATLYGAAFVDEYDSTWLSIPLSAATLSLTTTMRAFAGGGMSGSDFLVPVSAFFTGATLRSIGLLGDVHNERRDRPSIGRSISGVIGALAGIGSGLVLAQGNGVASPGFTLGGLLIGASLPGATFGWINAMVNERRDAGAWIALFIGTFALQYVSIVALSSDDPEKWNMLAGQLSGLSLTTLLIAMFAE